METNHMPNWQGDEEIEAIVTRHLPWVTSYVHKKLGQFPRQKSDTGDIIQEAMVQFLKYGPRIHLKNDVQFRALLCRIVENVICNQFDWFTARRRDMAREQPLPGDTVLNLDPTLNRQETPSQIVGKQQEEAWLRLGVELLDAGDQEVIVLRNWDDQSFPEIGKRLGISKDAARLRYYHAINHLIKNVNLLKNGKLNLLFDSDLLKEMEE